jgi:multidrug efflux system outer membrane protein
VRRIRSFAIGAGLLLAGCAVGPNYKRPDVPAPPQFRAGETSPAPNSFGDLKWFDVFQDETLRGLIRETLQANYDIRIAAQRVLDAEGQLQATRSALFPQVDGQASASRTGVNSPNQSLGGIFANASWEIDLFGKLRRATEAARADLLAIEENQRGVIQALVAQVASAYFDLREYDAELEAVRESITTREESVRLVKARLDGGVANQVEFDQATTLVLDAQAEAALLEKGQEQTENLISFLQGKQPGPVARGLRISDHPEPQVPAGLPSALLERRPDVREAEQQLVAANARVGVAKAAFYPSITLTASGGYQTVDLLGVVGRSGTAYGLGGVLDIPIFSAGLRSGNYKSARARDEALVLNYQKTVNGAFREVSDTLVGYQKSKEYEGRITLLAVTLRDQSMIANARYVGGVTSYLEVLDTERQRLSAEQSLAQAQRDVLTSIVLLYKALGGGWQ